MALPGLIIMDMPPAVKKLEQRMVVDFGVACGEEGAEYFADKLLEDIVCCLDQESYAMSSLLDYAVRQKESHQYNGQDAEGERLANEVLSVGHALLNEFQHLKIYVDGNLPYVYSGRTGTRTVILSKYN